ncbi:uncharacterized protein DFL_009284 [Arthrobotrys flagrans]|uniref:Carboxylic ester hydrolase n=1 Tax=Arthrobotrys flagrans TaxID=97331 RepID=A0A436ZR65_ARTFL|nr:hypothetical protein DFL_009284 [Arthrobotrys flagrans]
MKTFPFSLLLPLALQFSVGAEAGPFQSNNYIPQVNLRNGTVTGRYSPEYSQDFFLGVPYAQPPVGNLRFRPPQYLNNKRNVDASKYGNWCYGIGRENSGKPMSEDCLTLNIVRPVNTNQFAKLPVAVWIHGGSFIGGSGARDTYNTSNIVQQSTQMGTPIIAITINYRLGVWGFLGGKEVVGTRNANIGLKDQRLALHWIQENIRAFGGDPFKVTIFGESAGASSANWHQLAWGGRNDGLFHRAILQSGSGMMTPITWPNTFQSTFDSLAIYTSCADATDRLQCMRGVDNSVIWAWAQATSHYVNPMLDGDMIPEFASKLIKDGKFVRVPTIVGHNSDDGTSFTPTGSRAVNTEADLSFILKLLYEINDDLANQILANYDSSASLPPPENYTGITLPSNLGALFFRTSAIMTDHSFTAPRRMITQELTARNVPVWSYRFKCVSNGYPAFLGATHFTEIIYVFHNTDAYDPFSGSYPMNGPNRAEYVALSKMMARTWIKFFVNGNPNGAAGLPHWPQYGSGAYEMVFDKGAGNTFVGQDNYRATGVQWFIDKNPRLGR